MNLRARTRQILEVAEPGDRASRVFDLGIRALIALNVVAVFLETVPELQARAGTVFLYVEIVSVAVFTVEYLLRLWSAREDPRYSRPVTGRVRYALTPLLVIDLLAVLPAYLPHVGLDLRVLRGARLFRLFRILKLTRYSRSLRTIGRVFRKRREELLMTLALVGFLLVVASCLLYYAEHEAQPEAFSSIPQAMWWGVVTLTTVGYGDMYPITPLGRLMGGLFALSGILLIALPTAILGSGFVEEIQVTRSTDPGTRPPEPGRATEPESDSVEEPPGTARTCPHCGRVLDRRAEGD